MTLLLLHDTLTSSVSSVIAGIGDIPKPNGNPPKELQTQILNLLGWVLWLATAACVVGVLVTGARMAIAYRGGGDANVAQLGWVLLGCVLIGTATSIVNALL